MCILESIWILQAITEDAVEAGVAEPDRPCEHEPGNSKQVAQIKGVPQVSVGFSYRLLLITPDFLWITLLVLCIKLVQTGGKFGDFVPQICGQFVGR